MNLSSAIPVVNVRDAAEQFLRNVEEDCVTVNRRDHIEFTLRLSYNHVLYLNIFNEHLHEENVGYQDYIELLFEDMNEIELIIMNSTVGQHYSANLGKKMFYPTEVLGLESRNHLVHKDTSRTNDSVYTLDSIEYVIEYLCLLYEYDRNLLDKQSVIQAPPWE